MSKQPPSGNLVLAFAFALLNSDAHAGTISIENWRGHSVLRLSGEITTDLSDELATKIELADIWADGARVLLLDSPGGSVDEAFRISELLTQYPVRTVVPYGASCASACGSIIFVAGTYRTVEAFGHIGQHSCSRGGVPDQDCNDEIAEHAVANGVSYGSIAAFLTYTPPSEIIWFSREDVDGWGLSRYPGEEASGFERSEPRVIRMLSGVMPPAQSAWRLDFHGDGYRAFIRTASDAEREMQLNVFCYELLQGRLFLSMELYADVNTLNDAIKKVAVHIEGVSWDTEQPITIQIDDSVASVVMEIPEELIRRFLTTSNLLEFEISLREPLETIRATTYLSRSRANLLFASNHCSRADYDLEGRLLAP